jgi:hypothetical protein
MSRTLFACALLAFSGLAFAMPVQLELVYSDMSYSNAVRVGSGPGEHQIFDDSTRGIVGNVDLDVPVTNSAGGFGSAYTGIFQDVSTVGSDRFFAANFDANLAAIARLSGPVDSTAFAIAETRFQTFGMQFEVFEPVLYTGSFGVFANEFSPFEGDYFGPFFASGSILQPGMYAFTITPYLHDSSLWIFNEVTMPGQLLAGTASANYGFNFASVVPLPATLPLFALALAAMIWSRRRARARAH